MSRSSSALLSVTYVEPAYRHVAGLVHQRDPDARRRLRSLNLVIYEPRVPSDALVLFDHLVTFFK